MRSPNSTRAKTRHHALLITALASVLFVLASASFQSKTVDRWGELSGIAFGLPVSFVVQEQTYTPPLPYEATLAPVWEHPTTILLSWFLVDVLLIFCGITLLGTAMFSTVLRSRREIILRWFVILGYGSLACLLGVLLLLALAFVYLVFTVP